MILEVFSRFEYILQKILIQILLKLILILIAHRNVGFPENDAAALDGVNLV